MSNPIATFEEVQAVKNNPKVLLIDVREPSELEETGSIPGSINIPLGQVENTLKDMSPEQFQSTYKCSKPDKDFSIIFSCKSGRRGGAAQDIALKLGYSNAKNYPGSWLEWAAKNQ